ncbi:MAG: type II secretion system protein [Phycisphaerae bacterium]|nr:type II secretion system protein [Phycisphaerae bacterium]
MLSQNSDKSTRLHAAPVVGFTLIELLVVVAIISILAAVLLPSLSAARQRGYATKCLANLQSLGRGLVMYSTDHRDQLVPGRLPKLDNDHWRALVLGGWKYRPTFLAMMGTNVGIRPFDDPMPSKNMTDRFGEPGDQQNYSSEVYVCPAVADWTDERNGSYGYNYQFLGNSRLRDSSDPWSFKNWPVTISHVRSPSTTVAVGDSMGTAAAFPRDQRVPYSNNSRDPQAFANEGFNLDPPRLDLANGEIADHNDGNRSAVDPRHLGRANILWADAHASSMTLNQLGYQVADDGVVGTEGNNGLWCPTGRDEAWTQP